MRAAAPHQYVVSGGLEPHQVLCPSDAPAHCDCADFAKGHLCKHVLAVRMKERDRNTLALTTKLEATDAAADGSLDLFKLWFSAGASRELR